MARKMVIAARAAKVAERKKAGPSPIEVVRAAIRKGAKRAAIVSDIQHAISTVREVIPLGIPVVDHFLLGCGGLPVGRASEWYGEFGCGKSSAALAAIAGAQKIGTGLVALADDEQAMNPERAAVFGVGGSEDKLVLIEPESTEESLQAQIDFLESIPDGVGPNLLVWDSVAASIPDAEFGDKDVRAALARAMSTPVKKIRQLLGPKRCHWFVLNQARKKMGVLFGDDTTTPGGDQLKFAVSHRLQMWPGKALKDRSGQHVGKVITVVTTKSRFSPRRKAKIRLIYAAGWDTEWCVVDHAKTLGVCGPRETVAEGLPGALATFAAKGWTYSPIPEKKGKGEAPAADDVEEDPEDGLEG